MGAGGTVEFIYNKYINALKYIDVNLNDPNGKRDGSDNRDTYSAPLRVNNKIGGAYILTNTNDGYSYSLTSKIEKSARKGFGGFLGYTYALAKDQSSVGSTVNVNIPSVGGVNYLDLAYSGNDLRHRFVGAINYRIVYGGKYGGATMFTLGGVSASGYKLSYIFSNDGNGDGQTNDLIYVPKDVNDIKFSPLTVKNGSVQTIYTPTQQAQAFDAFINQNEYLSSRRGKYTERNGISLPWLTRFDFTASQDVFVKTGKTRHALQIRADIFNVSNLINNKGGG